MLTPIFQGNVAGGLTFDAATGALLVSSGAGGMLVNQGAPNAGGALAWPVQGPFADLATGVVKPLVIGFNLPNGTIRGALADNNGMLRICNPLTSIDGDTNQHSQLSISAAGTSRSLGVYPFVFNGATWDRMRGNTNGLQIIGPAAIDASIAGAPVLQGGRASLATPAAVSADGDAQAVWTDRKGRVHVTDEPGSDADIIGGSVAAAGLVITVPAGRTWKGTISVTVDCAVNVAGGAESAAAWLEIAGAGALPAPGVQLCRAVISLGSAAATGSGMGGGVSTSMSDVIIRAAAGAAATLTLTTSGTPTQTGASAIGQLL